jgi:hypothetical protein
VSRCNGISSANLFLSDLDSHEPGCVFLFSNHRRKRSWLHKAWQSCDRSFCTYRGAGSAHKLFFRPLRLFLDEGPPKQELSRPCTSIYTWYVCHENCLLSAYIFNGVSSTKMHSHNGFHITNSTDDLQRRSFRSYSLFLTCRTAEFPNAPARIGNEILLYKLIVAGSVQELSGV